MQYRFVDVSYKYALQNLIVQCMRPLAQVLYISKKFLIHMELGASTHKFPH